MKCISCQETINPKWKHAIAANVCPLCGGEVVQEFLKNLLTSLADTMAKLQQEYPDQLNDWLFSNHNYIKTDNPNLINYVPKEMLKASLREDDDPDFRPKTFTVKVKNEKGEEEEVEAQTLQSESKVLEFQKRAGIIPTKPVKKAQALANSITQAPPQFKSAAEKTAYLKGLKAEIETEVSQGVVRQTSVADLMTDEVSNEDLVSDYQSMMSGVNSSLPNAVDDEDSMVNQVLQTNLHLANGNTKKDANATNAKDLQALRNMMDKSSGSQNRMLNGESKDERGGFSRSS